MKKIASRYSDRAQQLAGGGTSLKDMTRQQWIELILLFTPALLVVAGAFWFASRFVEPEPPKRIAIITASQTGGYFATGTRYAAILKRSGVTLDVVPSAGSVENVKKLLDPASNIQVALLQGGTTNSKDTPGIVSLGRVFLEPVWVFYRSEGTADKLADLAGKRIVVGPVGSGTRALALEMLKPNGITETNATLLGLSGNDAIEAMRKGDADAAFFTSSAESPQIQTMLRLPDVKLMSFQQAEAYTRLFPFLSRIVLPKGAIDLVKNIPAQDVEMVAAVAALVAREDLHPALVGLLVEAAKEVHSRGGMFNRTREFPKVEDPELELSDDAQRAYQLGPSWLHRVLPFWMATFIERMKVMILPIATIMLPLIKLVPAIYRWRVRRRLLYWYGQLKRLEHRIASSPDRSNDDKYRSQLESIEQSVMAIPVPATFNEQFYSLRAAVDLVRNRLKPV